MPNSLKTAKSLSAKLQDLYGGLDQAEQKALSDLLETAAAQAQRRAIAGGRTKTSEAGELDNLLAKAKQEIEGGGEVAIGPTITITTTITITASHPTITCKAQ